MLEEIPPGNAVLRGQHERPRAQDRPDFGRDGGNLVRLHAQHDQIGLAEFGDAIARSYASDDVLSPPSKYQAVLANGLQLRAARDDADLFAGLGELGGQQAADGARADHAYLHRSFLSAHVSLSILPLCG